MLREFHHREPQIMGVQYFNDQPPLLGKSLQLDLSFECATTLLLEEVASLPHRRFILE